MRRQDASALATILVFFAVALFCLFGGYWFAPDDWTCTDANGAPAFCSDAGVR